MLFSTPKRIIMKYVLLLIAFVSYKKEEQLIEASIVEGPQKDYFAGAVFAASSDHGGIISMADRNTSEAIAPLAICVQVAGEKESRSLLLPAHCTDRLQAFHAGMKIKIKKLRWKCMGISGCDYTIA